MKGGLILKIHRMTNEDVGWKIEWRNFPTKATDKG